MQDRRKETVELRKYHENLLFKQGDVLDLDLLNEKRSLIYSGKLLRQPDGVLEWNRWSTLLLLLFDNYLVMTTIEDPDGVTKYVVHKRPIPLDLLTLVNFSDSPTRRSTSLLRIFRSGRHGEGAATNTSDASPDTANDSKFVYPLTLHHNNRMGGEYNLYAESQQARMEWKAKLEEALVLRKAVQDSNKVFDIKALSVDTFLMPANPKAQQRSGNQEVYTGKVTCSVPFTTVDGRALVAIGCAEGVWIGLRHDPSSWRRVLNCKLVTQCAMLDEFGILLVLADKALYAYQIEVLVPTSFHTSPSSPAPQKLNGSVDVHFFRIGTLDGRSVVIYVKKKGLDSIFRILEPVGDKINIGSQQNLRPSTSDWFRVYKDFFLPSEAYDVMFLKTRVVILSTQGFELVDMLKLETVAIPHREDTRSAQLARRCKSARPKGMFRSSEEEFLLCYDEFGVYVDKNGDQSRSMRMIEWEGTAQRVVFHSPYILIFDTQFIEIRHIETGHLVQIIPGNDIRCIYDGWGIDSNVAAMQNAQVHIVMTNPKGVSTENGEAISQNVFELVPL